MEFMDITFCPFYKECMDGQTCRRALTEKVKADAIDWWGSDDAPICMFLEPPQCFKEIKKEKIDG